MLICLFKNVLPFERFFFIKDVELPKVQNHGYTLKRCHGRLETDNGHAFSRMVAYLIVFITPSLNTKLRTLFTYGFQKRTIIVFNHHELPFNFFVPLYW